jgi:hypothetical protein
LQGLCPPNEIADGDTQNGIFVRHIHRIDLDQVAEVLLERSLDEVLGGGGELIAVRRKDQPEQPAPKIGAIHPFAWRGEEHLLDQVANVRIVVDLSRPAARVEVIWKIDVHVAMTRGWVVMTSKPWPVGTQTAWLVCVMTGTPPAKTRVAPTTHCALTHGGVEVLAKAQPATTKGVARVTMGWPLTVTLGNGAVGCAGPACMQVTTAPR